MQLKYPDDNNDERCIVNNYPIKNLWGENYSSDFYQFKFLKMYYNQIKGYQKEIYNNYLSTLDESKELQIMEQRVGAQISNIVYPSIDVLQGEGEIDYSKMQSSAFLSNFKPDMTNGILHNDTNNVFNLGFNVSLNTDNRLMSNTTVQKEIDIAKNLGIDNIDDLFKKSASYSFLN